MLKSNRLADGNHAGKLVVAIFVLFSVISSVTDKSPSSGLVTSPTNFSTPCKPDWPPEFLAILELQIVDPVVIGRVPGVVEMLREVDDLLMVERTEPWGQAKFDRACFCLLYTSPSPRDQRGSRMPSSA